MIKPRNPINSNLIEVCPALNSYQKELLNLIYVEEKSIFNAAKHFKKKSPTISSQYKNAVEKYDKWASSDGRKIIVSVVNMPKISPRKIMEKDSNQTESEGELASKAFKLFKKGMKPSNVVIELKKPPSIINKLFREYKGIPENTPIEEFLDLNKRLEQLDEETNDIIGLIAKQQNDYVGLIENDAESFNLVELSNMLWNSDNVNKLLTTFSEIKSPGNQLKNAINKIIQLTKKVEKNQQRLDAFIESCPDCGHHLYLSKYCKICDKDYISDK